MGNHTVDAASSYAVYVKKKIKIYYSEALGMREYMEIIEMVWPSGRYTIRLVAATRSNKKHVNHNYFC
jgi:hypothetical protein